MADRLERDKDGNVVGKLVAEHPQEPSEPSPALSARPMDTSAAPNSTLAERAKARQKAAGKRVGAAENKAVEK